jgi:hypothetical protein
MSWSLSVRELACQPLERSWDLSFFGCSRLTVSWVRLGAVHLGEVGSALIWALLESLRFGGVGLELIWAFFDASIVL